LKGFILSAVVSIREVFYDFRRVAVATSIEGKTPGRKHFSFLKKFAPNCDTQLLVELPGAVSWRDKKKLLGVVSL